MACWKRLNKCKAHYRIMTFDDDIYNVESRWTVYQLVSYETKIMQCIYDSKYDKWSVDCSPYITTSRTTIMHVYKFLRNVVEMPMSEGIAYIRDTRHGITPELSMWFDSVFDVEWSFWSNDAFGRVWRV